MSRRAEAGALRNEWSTGRILLVRFVFVGACMPGMLASGFAAARFVDPVAFGLAWFAGMMVSLMAGVLFAIAVDEVLYGAKPRSHRP